MIMCLRDEIVCGQEFLAALVNQREKNKKFLPLIGTA
jgi:hypothetical protein